MGLEIYARMIKDLNIDDDPTGATTVTKLMSPIPLPGVICGDSLDIPFLKWIKLTGFKNSIGFDSGTVRSINAAGELVEKKYGTSAGTYSQARKPIVEGAWGAGAAVQGEDQFTHTQQGTMHSRFGGTNRQQTRTQRSHQVGEEGQRTQQWVAGTTSEWQGGGAGANQSNWKGRFGWGARDGTTFAAGFDNENLKINLPDHNGVEFTKKVDNSTPQLAYACSCQEPIGTAVFLFRSRIGLGVRGIRVPHLSIILKGCLVSGWELNGEEETCKMSYREVRWCTYDQLADFNIATGMSARWWDTDGKGGESPWMYLVMGLLGAATIAAGAVDTFASNESPTGGSAKKADDVAITSIE